MRNDMWRLNEAIERLERVTMGEGERRGWFAPRPSGAHFAALLGYVDGQALREVEELEALWALPSGGRG